ncbi:hypothetical protein HDU78_010461 [Chytriomyces hyalinus]|nr:hypothetical protein HDU78_010461 [Chytriomyces hyalinus]
MLVPVLACLAAFSILVSGQSVAVLKSTGRTHPRLEINYFFSTTRDCGRQHASLLIRALTAQQKALAADPLAFSNVAGIHGQPYYQAYDLWSGGKGQGYCPHGSTEFPYWHRAYMALFEDSLKKSAVKIAAGFNNANFTRCAATMRLPYYDWASWENSDKGRLNSIFTRSTFSILTASGTFETVANPLSTSTVPMNVRSFLPSTFRNSVPLPQYDMVQARAQVRSMLDSTLWSDFSNHNNEGSKRYDSLEYIHDLIHVSIGGWMSNVGVAAFDPVFFFHHCNIDRLLALWSHINANNPYGFPSTTTANKLMAPFRALPNNDGSAWTATQMRNTSAAFGYTYPELVSNPSASSLKTTLVRMYSITRPVARRAAEPFAGRSVFAHFNVLKNSLGGSFLIRFYVNGQYAAAGCVFAMSGMEMADYTISGSAVLTDAMLEAGGGLIKSPGSWKKAVTVKIFDMEGREVPASRVPSLKIKLRGARDSAALANGFRTIAGQAVPSSFEWDQSPVEVL